jgi:predicted metal-binding membrane protein
MKLEPLIHEENLKRLRKLLTRAPREDPHLLGIMRIAVAFRAIGGLDKAQLGPLRVQHNIILVLLLALAAASWAVLVWQHGDATMDMTMGSPPIGLRAPLFLASWVIMMVAMMFPTAAPMILAFHRVQAVKYQLDVALVSTWVFVGAYLLVWGHLRGLPLMPGF